MSVNFEFLQLNGILGPEQCVYGPYQPKAVVNTISTFNDPEEGAFYFLKNKKSWNEVILENNKQLDQFRSSVLLVDEKLNNQLKDDQAFIKWSQLFNNIFIIKEIDICLSRLSKIFYDQLCEQENDLLDGRELSLVDIHPFSQIAQNVFLAKNVVIEEGVTIMPGCCVMSGCHIKKGSVLFPNVTLYSRTTVGENCRIHSGSVIGADGFGYHFYQGKHHKFWHLGKVVIQDDVEIGALTSIDRATFGITRIGKGTKIDNQVQIGHNCQVGNHVILCGQVGLAGSGQLGDYVVVGGKAGIGPGIKVGAQSKVAGSAMVTTNCAEKMEVAGHPARPLKHWLKAMAKLYKL